MMVEKGKGREVVRRGYRWSGQKEFDREGGRVKGR